MPTLSIVEFLTLDGVMQGLGGPDEDRDGGFEYGGWGAPYAQDVYAHTAGRGLPTTTAYLFGRRTYEKMAEHWPHEPADNPVAASLNAAEKYVASRTLTSVDWAGSHLLGQDVPAAVRELKAQGEGTIVVLGSGLLIQTLIEHDLIDQYRLFVHPLVLGTGKRLFRETARPLALRLIECTPTPAGVLLLTYERA